MAVLIGGPGLEIKENVAAAAATQRARLYPAALTERMTRLKTGAQWSFEPAGLQPR
jgi:hypothetical protein